MADQIETCRTPQQHPRHMCRLFQQGLMMEIDQRSSQPTVACAKCGARADRAESLCQPRAL